MKKTELEKIENSVNAERSIHILTFSKYKELGYEKTQDWIRQNLVDSTSDTTPILNTYLKNSVNKNEQFEPYKNELLDLVLELDADKLELWAFKMKEINFSKQFIFEVLSELFVFIQFNPKTENADSYYDLVADFLDRFTYLGKGFKIFPNEPDC
jgi:hypothetical protein